MRSVQLQNEKRLITFHRLLMRSVNNIIHLKLRHQPLGFHWTHTGTAGLKQGFSKKFYKDSKLLYSNC